MGKPTASHHSNSEKEAIGMKVKSIPTMATLEVFLSVVLSTAHAAKNKYTAKAINGRQSWQQ
jgi:hypothetical protein